jgi:hypothetical protein
MKMIITTILTFCSYQITQVFATAPPTTQPTLSPSVSPTFQPSVLPTPFPSNYPTLFPTVYLQPKDLGYYYSSTYFGITCNNIVGNEDTIILMNGNSFGNCLVGYNGSGYAIGSSSYVSTCEMDVSGTAYIAYVTEYHDTACQDPKSAPVMSYYNAGCETVGDKTTQYYCIPSSKSPPYQSLSGGYVRGYTSTQSDCKNGLAHSYTWVKANQCVEEYSSGTNRNTSQKFSCDSDSITKVQKYYDGTCSKSVATESSRVSLCQFQYSSSETSVYDNYLYGDCQGSQSSSSNDDISMSDEDYAGVITGTLIAGMILGAILGAVILIVCCRFSKV